MPNHYEILGVAPSAGADEIRRAYRRKVKEHHPDVSGTPESAEMFAMVVDAYEVLSNSLRRANYDQILASEAKIAAQSKPQQSSQRAQPTEPPGQAPKTAPPPRSDRAEVKSPPPKSSKPKADPEPPKPRPGRPPSGGWNDPSQRAPRAETELMEGLLKQQRYRDAEQLARRILVTYPQEARAFAVLGAACQARGDVANALKQYSYAVQFDPANVAYQRTYERLLSLGESSAVRSEIASDPGVKPKLIAGGALLAVMLCYVALAKESPMWPGFPPVSKWSLGLMSMLLVGGVICGSVLSLTRLVGRFQLQASNAALRFPPLAVMALASCVNFWLAAGWYAIQGIFQNAANVALTRIVAAVAGWTLLVALVSQIQHAAFAQTLVWGGNLAFLGALFGWSVADSVAGDES